MYSLGLGQEQCRRLLFFASFVVLVVYPTTRILLNAIFELFVSLMRICEHHDPFSHHHAVHTLVHHKKQALIGSRVP